jgi:hypothetical protein
MMTKVEGGNFKIHNFFQAHMIRHGGVKKFSCFHCGTRSATKAELKTHMNSKKLFVFYGFLLMILMIF